MRKTTLALIAALCAFLLCGCKKAEDMGSLAQFSRPYTGEYVCRKILLGGEDFTERFDYIKLELKRSGDFLFSYRTGEGNEGEYRGRYAVTDAGEITFTANAGLSTVSRSFPMRKGAVLIDLPFGQKLLHAEFAFP